MESGMLAGNAFLELAVLLCLAALFGLVARLFRQPLIVAFIALGVVAGPSALDLIRSEDSIHLLADIGIAVLLFVVGLKLDLSLIRTTGPVALLTGLGQVFFTALVGYGLSLALGFAPMASAYIAVALTFSSTIIIVKLLSDKKEIDSLHGQIAVGFLIVQDLVVILVMILLSASGQGDQEGLVNIALSVVLKGLGLLIFSGLAMRYLLPSLTHYLATAQELLLLFAIAWAMALAAASEGMGFSREVGAFLAGVALASTHYREVISSRLVSIRDFLLLFFFINLGAQLDLSLLGSQLGAAIVLSLFVLMGNPLIVMIIMGLMGYRKRTGFLAGLTVAQISEISLIFAALGLSLGHINEEIVGLITLVGLITIGLSTYLILYSHRWFAWLAPVLSLFEKRNPYREAQAHQNEVRRFDAIVFGLGRYGGNLVHRLSRQGLSVLGVDFDPSAVKQFLRLGFDAQYGDLEDPALPEQLPLAHTRYIISSIPELSDNLTLLKTLKTAGFRGRVVLTAHHSDQANRLQNAGADQVLMPFDDAAEVINERLEEI